MAGWVEGIRRALVLGIVPIEETVIERTSPEQAPSLSPSLDPSEKYVGLPH